MQILEEKNAINLNLSRVCCAGDKAANAYGRI